MSSKWWKNIHVHIHLPHAVSLILLNKLSTIQNIPCSTSLKNLNQFLMIKSSFSLLLVYLILWKLLNASNVIIGLVRNAFINVSLYSLSRLNVDAWCQFTKFANKFPAKKFVLTLLHVLDLSDLKLTCDWCCLHGKPFKFMMRYLMHVLFLLK